MAFYAFGAEVFGCDFIHSVMGDARIFDVGAVWEQNRGLRGKRNSMLLNVQKRGN